MIRRCWLSFFAERQLSPSSLGVDMFNASPSSPYFAVIFTSQRTADDNGYDEMAEHMVRLAAQQPGFLGIDSARGTDGLGITVSYWTDEQAIHSWRQNAEHSIARERGQLDWYSQFTVRVARVERAYGT